MAPKNLAPSKIACVYCGNATTGARRGEHIVAKAIGGTLTIRDECPSRNVCKDCNNGKLSELDNEFCTRSPIAIAGAEAFNSALLQAWEVDQTSGNVLVEAKPDLETEQMHVYPQILFLASGPTLRFDYAEALQFGMENTAHVIVKSAFRAFQKHIELPKKK